MSAEHVRRAIRVRLASMTSPGACSRWGGPEALELQVLQLIEMRELLDHTDDDALMIRQQYRAFIAADLQSSDNTFAWAILGERGECAPVELPALLGRFLQHLVALRAEEATRAVGDEPR